MSGRELSSEWVVPIFLAIVTGLTGWTLLAVVEMKSDLAVVVNDVERMRSQEPLTQRDLDSSLEVFRLRMTIQEASLETLRARVVELERFSSNQERGKGGK